MKQKYQTVASLKKECVTFADTANEFDFSALSNEELYEKYSASISEEETAAIVSEVIFRLKGLRLFESLSNDHVLYLFLVFCETFSPYFEVVSGV